MRKGQGPRPLLDARGLRALRRHCITHRHDSVIDITKWAPEYFQKPLSVNTIRRAICRCQLRLYHAKRKPYVNMVQKRRRVLWTKAHLKWTVSKWKSVLRSDESKFDILAGNHGRRVLRAKEERDLPACHQSSVQKPASLMVWGCISAYGMGSLHVLEGTIYAERYMWKVYNLPQELLKQFYSAIIESVLCTSIIVWFSSATKSDLRRPWRVVRTAERIIGTTLPTLQELYLSRVNKRAGKITLDPSHPAHSLFALLPSGRRYRALSTRTTRHRNSFFPQAIHLMNTWH